jgi:hypothetical protein
MKTVSLDAVVKGTDDLRYGGLVSEDDHHERWEALTAARRAPDEHGADSL